MTALLVAVVLVLAVVVVMVVGLLRSHAEILRALEVVNRASRGAASGLAAGLPLAPDREGEVQAAPILGTTVRGDQISLVLSAGGQNTLVAFLTSGCSTCQHFWDAFRQEDAPPLPGNARLVIVTKDSSEESPSKLLQLSPDGVSVVMSGGAWTDYDVPSAPYFVYVDGFSGNVRGEGAAIAWSQVQSLLADALFDAAMAEGKVPPDGRGEATEARNRRADQALAAAGIRPDDPSFWGSGTSREPDPA